MSSTDEPARRPNWAAQIAQFFSQRSLAGTLAIGIVVVAVVLGSLTYLTLTGLAPFAPSRWVVLSLLVANLATVLVLFGLIAWRIVRLVMERAKGAVGAKLHMRLVVMFSILAIMPAIIVAVFAFITLNRGLDVWFSDRTRTIISNAETVAQAYLTEHQHVLRGDIAAMAADLNRAEPLLETDIERFQQIFARQVAWRSLPAGYLLRKDGEVLLQATASISGAFVEPDAAAYDAADKNEIALSAADTGDRIWAMIKLEAFDDVYLYVARFIDPRVLEHLRQTTAAVNEYKSLEERRTIVQVTFALFYVAVALIVLMAAVWLGLGVANRIVRPIGSLASAAEKVSQGDLSARVEDDGRDDELAVLGRTFNRMTGQLETQRQELIDANVQLDERRQFTEAVLSGVSAGVLGLDERNVVTHANQAALDLFGLEEERVIGRPLSYLMPEMASILITARNHPQGRHQEQLIVTQGGIERTLNVRVAGDPGQPEAGFVMTFDDISELVVAQRNSAWSDIARRIAHEIKNPLTPIQLSAERLKRKYANEVVSDKDVFEQCTNTIIRQVGDIGRMVDEFSSFARMPAAVMRTSELDEIARQAVFLQRVGHPEIEYRFLPAEEPVTVQCDPRLVSQALTNVLKNAAEAIDAAQARGLAPKQNEIEVVIEKREGAAAITVTDTGVGLPATDRLRLTEPYMTTREKGTGLGLAIVHKIMEDHGGHLTLEDAPRRRGRQMGARVSLVFPLAEPPVLGEPDAPSTTEEGTPSDEPNELAEADVTGHGI